MEFRHDTQRRRLPVGTTFETHGAADAWLQNCSAGKKYSAIVVGSGFWWHADTRRIGHLDAHQTELSGFLNAGGGLYRISEELPPLIPDVPRPMGLSAPL